ncbi:NAD(P)-binding domain-containing protein [Microbispora sp. RL4-1S]|uniref:NAD(P)-binding domain-containing protein n=1 Tax=Microbispora oryzae TaxID=2806554 RepID=A0A941AGJ3_9ACTN|nr:NAD(P)-binding domain-containing protein [Microbispora oryzae]MBP2703000.1 NAD(P)-binding domain-containing protein [Microbispora oryzae]
MDLRIGIIGCGRMGTALARLADLHGMPLLLANRTPARAAALAAGLSRARAVTPERVAAESDLTILATPIDATCRDLSPRLRHGRSVIVDVSNPCFDQPAVPGYRSAAQRIAAALPGRTVVKALNCLSARWITAYVRAPVTIPPTVPIAGDDPAAKLLVAEFCSALGFDTADAGPLANSRCVESLTELLLCIDADSIAVRLVPAATMAEASATGVFDVRS